MEVIARPLASTLGWEAIDGHPVMSLPLRLPSLRYNGSKRHSVLASIWSLFLNDVKTRLIFKKWFVYYSGFFPNKMFTLGQIPLLVNMEKQVIENPCQ